MFDVDGSVLGKTNNKGYNIRWNEMQNHEKLIEVKEINEAKQEIKKAHDRAVYSTNEIDLTIRRSPSADIETEATSSIVKGMSNGRLKDSELTTSPQSKLCLMKSTERNSRSHLLEVNWIDEPSLINHAEQQENGSRAVSTSEKSVNTDVCELYYSSVHKKYAELLSKIKKLTSHIESSKEGRNADTIKESELWKEVGTLTTRNVHLEKDLIDVRTLERSLRTELDEANEKIDSLNEEIRCLEATLNERIKTTDVTNRYLLEENSKIKQRKAALRCEYIMLKREYGKLLYNQCASTVVSKKTDVVDRMRQKIALCDKNLSPISELLSFDVENVAPVLGDCKKTVDGVSLETLKQELSSARENNHELKTALKIVDAQCEKLLEIKRRLENSRDITVQRLKEARNQLNFANHELTSKVEFEVQLKSAISERNRLRTKVEYLTEELNAAHVEYSEKMKLIVEKFPSSSNTENSVNMRKLAADKRELDVALKACQRELELRKSEFEQHKEELLSLQETQSSIIADNAKLRTSLAEATEKATQYKDEAENLRLVNVDLNQELEKCKKNEHKLNEKLCELKQTYNEKNRLVAYLQSRTVQVDERPSRPLSSNSTLISRGSSFSIANSSIPCDSNCTLQPADERSCASPESNFDTFTESISSDDLQNGKFSGPSRNFSGTCYPQTQKQTLTQIGIMKHDIPHRWENFFNIRQMKCTACFEGIPRLRHSLKCKDCGIVAHRGCALTIGNTCGLPVQCANYYLGAVQVIDNSISGCLEIWRSDSLWGYQWLRVWATLDGQNLSFFANAGHSADSANDNRKIVLSIDLNKEKWRVHMRAVSESLFSGGLSRENLSSLLELRLQKFNLFILTPSIRAKQRWLQALQSATCRQVLSQHRSVRSHIANLLLFALDAPLNLTVCCAKTIGHRILIGAQEGLFTANLKSKELPHVVVGLQSVYQMELMEELDMLAAISGHQRQLVFIHMSDIRAVFMSESMAVRATPLPQLTSCHLMTVYSNSSDRLHYLLVADAEKIEILQFNSNFKIFTQFNSVKTSEPVSCLLSVPGGLIFGADQFYFMDIRNFKVRPYSLPETEDDWPRAAISIGENEFLLAFHNFGVFVDIDGRKSRVGMVGWERSPMEFVYAAPFMYIVHLETLEILMVATNEGSDSKLFMDDREVFRCKSAHFIGRGRYQSEVLFALFSAERTEIHSFSNLTQARKTSHMVNQN